MIKRRAFVKLGVLSVGSLTLMGAKPINTFAETMDEPLMKRVGLLGGTSWHSTIDYYRYICQMVNDRKGERVNPPLLLFTMNQHQINSFQDENQWEKIADLYAAAANDLIKAGAQALVLCANTAHAVYEPVSKRVNVPILHIADATAGEAKMKGLKTLGLLGTQFTMEKEYIKGRFSSQFGITTLVPEKEARMELQRIIREELSSGQLKSESKKYLIEEMDKLKKQGAEGMILGCTEFPMLVKPEDYPLPLFDTTYLHSKMAGDFILGV